MALLLCPDFSAGEYFATNIFQWHFILTDFIVDAEDDGLKMKTKSKYLNPGKTMTMVWPWRKATV